MSERSAIESFKRDPQVRKIVQAHADLSLAHQLSDIAFDWLVMAAAVATSIAYPHPLIYLASVIVIACRQHALLVVMHEASHFRISKNIRVNDLIGNFLAAYPTLISTEDYRKHHTAHHKHTNTDQDPDWVRKAPLPEWQYPQTAPRIFQVLTKQLFVGGYQWISLMTKMSKRDWKKGLYWAAVLMTVTAFQVWPEFLLYWMVPLLTLFPLVQRVRSISEHFGLPREHELNSTRNILAGPIERFLLSPHQVNYHLAHHLFPSVPQHQLKSLHQSLMSHPVYAELAHNNDSFFAKNRSVFNDLRKTSTSERKTKVA